MLLLYGQAEAETTGSKLRRHIMAVSNSIYQPCTSSKYVPYHIISPSALSTYTQLER